MNRTIADKKGIVIKTVLAIGLSTVIFWGCVQAAYASEVNKTDTVANPAVTVTTGKAVASGIPAGYVKADYQVKLAENSAQATAKDLSKEAAAEKGAQDLWRLFRADLTGQTIEMTYLAPGPLNRRAEWTGNVIVSKSQTYYFTVDAVTGECSATGQDRYWNARMNVGMDKALMSNHSQYDALAKETAEKYQFVSSKVSSVEYACQGASSNSYGRNADISMKVNYENGQQVQLTFSRYNQEFLSVGYNSWMEDMKAVDEREASRDAGKVVVIQPNDAKGGTSLIAGSEN